ncbi:hypothetical protein RGQ29_020465 [Quercus rubra]|uniref:TF-B3 domain-containing protein n=1 Tax=Quercus rubra TaxID=3512 RepID=A0AAN7FCD7_QUERU|nr:hypothetical protein RGQ29_020465 [Quercus rubra]
MDTFFTYTPTTTTTNNTNTMSFPSTTTNTTAAAASSTPSMPSSQYYFPPHDETQTLMQFPYAYPLELVQAGQQGQAFTYPSYPFVIGMNSSQPHLVPDEQQQERRLADAWTTKVARCKRKMARQKSLCLTKDSASCASSTQMNTQGLAVYDAVDADHVQSANNVNEDPYTFRTPDNKRLRFLLKKELKNSDVGSLGRIVLPKREAEENLPILSDKDGIQIVIQDVYSNQAWIMKYKYWLNNKSRMYVLENTVDFVKQNGLVIGDSITLYEDELKNLYFSIKKVDKPVNEPLYKQQYTNLSINCNNFSAPFMHESRDEEEASLALLIEQLRHQEEQDANSLATLPIGGTSSHSRLI